MLRLFVYFVRGLLGGRSGHPVVLLAASSQALQGETSQLVLDERVAIQVGPDSVVPPGLLGLQVDQIAGGQPVVVLKLADHRPTEVLARQTPSAVVIQGVVGLS